MSGSDPRVEVRRSARRRRTVSAHREGETIVVLVPARMSRTQERHHVDTLVARLLAREARSTVPRGAPELVDRARRLSERFLAPALGTAPVPVAVSWSTSQRKRWGSCTPADQTIRLSSRLQPMPSWVSDYVLLHELVHLVEPNHSARFHTLLAAYPEADRARGYLEGYADATRLPPADGSGAPGGADDLVDGGVEPGTDEP